VPDTNQTEQTMRYFETQAEADAHDKALQEEATMICGEYIDDGSLYMDYFELFDVENDYSYEDDPADNLKELHADALAGSIWAKSIEDIRFVPSSVQPGAVWAISF